MATQSISEAELRSLQKILRPGMNVIDLGAGDGAWSSAALAIQPALTIHATESGFAHYRSLLSALGPAIARGAVIPHNFDLLRVGLSNYVRHAELRRVDLLRIGAVDADLALQNARELLAEQRIDYILLPAGSEKFSEAFAQYRVELFRLGGESSAPVLAVNDRFRIAITGDMNREPFDLPRLAKEFSINVRGVIQFGAYRGENAAGFFEAGASSAVLVEANPTLAAALSEKFAGDARVQTLHAAACETSGPITFRLTSGLDQCSSILPLKKHAEIYPNIREAEQVTVPGLSLDDLLAQQNLDAKNFNVLVLDIQGAELQTLRGAATKMLAHLDAILTEVNFDELYENCGQIEQLDAFLAEQGFTRVATDCRYHPTWGDALYLRRSTTDLRLAA